MYYAFLKKSNKKYYFTGKGFDTVPFRMKKYKTLSGLKNAIKPFVSKIPAGYGLYSEKVKAKQYKKSVTDQAKKGVTRPGRKKTAKKRKNNPVPKSKWHKLKEASARFEEFSGHQAKFIDERGLKKMDVGFKIGTIDFIGYTTKRDGRVEKYVHKFKKKCQPILASNYDGKYISVVGGNYHFTDRGIVDK